MFYEIPLKKRFTKIYSPRKMIFQEKVFCIDDIGIIVQYAKRADVTTQSIRNHFHLVEDSQCIVEARNLETAVRKFYKNWEGARTGGKERTSKAIWINLNKSIIELPYCKFLKCSSQHRFICGEEVKGECFGEMGMCVLEGYDPPLTIECPISELDIFEGFKSGRFKIEKVSIDGIDYKFINTNKT